MTQSLKVVIVSALVAVLVSVGIGFLPFQKLQSNFWYLSVAFHVLISFLLSMVLFRKNTDPKEFVFKVMFTSMGRLLLCMIGIFIYSLIDKPNFIGFSVHFMLHYIIFTILEINYLLKFVKTQSNEK